MIAALLLDLSGVLYEGDDAVPGAREAVASAAAAGLDIRFVTNTSQKPPGAILDKLHGLGFAVEKEQLFTAVDAAKQWLAKHDKRPFCLVHEAIRGEFADMDQTDPDAVLIADAARGFNYDNLNRAFQLCMEGAPLLAVGYNRYYRSGDQLLLDAGAFVRAVEFAAGVEAVIVGKPGGEFFAEVVATTGVEPSRALMVGDDVFGDVEGALNAGLRACLVRTGKYRAGDEKKISGDFSLAASIVEALDEVVTSPRR